MQEVQIYSDGSSRGNPGRGGYGSILRYVDADGQAHEKELAGGFILTTNNRMELLGAIVALEALKTPCKVTITSDSQYLVNAFNKNWIKGWQARGWKGSNKKPVKNIDLWQRLLRAMKSHEVTFVWIEGHAGHVFNERCDTLATTAADGSNLIEDAGFRPNQSNNLF